MNHPHKVRRVQERRFSPHHLLLETAQRARDAAALKRVGWQHDALTAITFSALTIEAICNSVGDHVFADWKDFESASPTAKLRLIAERLEVTYDKASEPWQTAIWLFRFRNLIAHAKPEYIIEDEVLSHEEYASRRFDPPESKLEKQITLAGTHRATAAAVEIVKLLIAKMPHHEEVGLAVDGWSGTTVPHDDA